MRDEIIEMAREAGFELDDSLAFEPEVIWYATNPLLERFYDLAVQREREECAKVCDEMAAHDKLSNYYKVAAKAIRARGEKQ